MAPEELKESNRGITTKIENESWMTIITRFRNESEKKITTK